jgi:hypothetical protein
VITEENVFESVRSLSSLARIGFPQPGEKVRLRSARYTSGTLRFRIGERRPRLRKLVGTKHWLCFLRVRSPRRAILRIQSAKGAQP